MFEAKDALFRFFSLLTPVCRAINSAIDNLKVNALAVTHPFVRHDFYDNEFNCKARVSR